MVYLIFAIMTAPVITVAMRLSNGRVKSKTMMFLANYATCILCSLFFLNISESIPKEEYTFPLWYGIIMGFFFLVTFLFYEFNIRKNGVILSNIFSKLGKIIPVIVTMIFFNELPTPLKIIGIVLSVIAIIIMNIDFKKKDDIENTENPLSDKKSFNPAYLLLVIFLLFSGICDSSTTVFKHISIPELNGFFLLSIFGSAFIFSLILLIIKREKIGLTDPLFGLIIGIPNYFSSFLTLKALETIPAQVVYPTLCVGSILVVTIFGVIMFKEKLKFKDYIGALIIIAALIILNI